MSEKEALAYLDSVEKECCHMDMAKERAACGEYPHEPTTAADYLAWMEDELEIQKEQDRDYPEEERRPYIEILERDIAKLRSFGIVANPKAFS